LISLEAIVKKYSRSVRNRSMTNAVDTQACDARPAMLNVRHIHSSLRGGEGNMELWERHSDCEPSTGAI